MRRLLIAALAVLAACGGIKDQPLTERTMDRVRESKDLTEQDRTLLAGYMARTAWDRVQKGDSTPDFFDPDVTVGEAIEAQRRHVHADSVRRAGEDRAADQARQRREADLARARSAVSVTVSAKRNLPSDANAGRYSNVAVLTVGVANTGDQPVTGVKGRLVVRDLFDDEIIALEYKHDDPLAPGARAQAERFYEINRYIEDHGRFYQTDFEKMKVAWEPQVILFADGTRLDVAEPAREPLFRLP
jgi:hypothetical protein